MKKLLSTNYSAGAFNTATLLLRVGTGLLMIHHGYQKLIGFAGLQDKFISFLGLGSTVSLALVIFAELVCSALVLLGLFTRLATIPLIVAMSVAFVKAHGGHVFGEHGGELALHFLMVYVVLLLVGPGRVSVDSMLG